MRLFALWLSALALLAGCERARQDMYDQPRYKPFAASRMFDDGASARTPPEGTQPRARGAFAGSSGGRVGAAAVEADVLAERAQANPYPVDLALLRRGQERFTIYCMPCHSPAGDGDGLVVRRGFPPPPTYHQDRLRNAPDRHIYDVIKNGYGVMVPYGDRVEPADRWAIVAYIRALQLSQHAPVAELPADDRTRLASIAPGQAQTEAQPDAIAQPNARRATPPESQALPPPPSSSAASSSASEEGGVQARPASQPALQSLPGRTPPQLAPPLEQRVGTPPRNHPGPGTGVPPGQGGGS
jgi:mono/diheme cytochrome c family protein